MTTLWRTYSLSQFCSQTTIQKYRRSSFGQEMGFTPLFTELERSSRSSQNPTIFFPYSKPDQIQFTPSHLIYLRYILTFNIDSLVWQVVSFPLVTPQIPAYICLFLHVCQMTYSFHCPWFNHLEQLWSSWSFSFLNYPVNSYPLSPYIFLSNPFWSLCFSFSMVRFILFKEQNRSTTYFNCNP